MKQFKQRFAWLLIAMLVISAVGCAQPASDETSMEVVTEASSSTEATTQADNATQAVSLEDAVSAYFTNMPDHIYKISQSEFVDMAKAGIDGTILDIRSAADYAQAHVKGAVNAPWGTDAIPAILTKIPADKPVYVYCVSGQTAGQTVFLLNLAGFDARSVNLGYKFGISKVEGVDEVVTTDATTLDADVTTIDADVLTTITDYYSGLADVKDTEYANYKISEADLKAKIDAGEQLNIVSVRSAMDYALGHIEGATNIPFGNDMAAGFADLPKDEKVIVYCYSGQTAGQTVAAMRVLGIDAVSLNGGVGVGSNAPLGWINQGNALVSEMMQQKVTDYYTNMPDHIYKIKQDEFVNMVAEGIDGTILDIRSADDYAAGHVKGAVNAPWGTAISEILSKIPQDKPLYVYCYTGQTAGQAVATLNIAGFDARSVNLGYNLGISKVENYDSVNATETATLTEDVTAIDPAIQKALTVYYSGLAGVSDSIYKNYKVSEDNLKQLIDDEEDSYILSVRSADSYAEGHIKGAVNLPFGNDMAAGFADLPTDKPIVVYCYTGQTAGQTVATLRLLGYNAVSLNGGMGMDANAPMGWSNKGYEVVQ